ncbi:histidine kinase [Xanthobacter sp. V4C-4]|uniref:sensor histidine kinase n=1 Tax=Xanthobacter cornucopiae TaxID=3119924 RepID=UPI0037292FB3
MDSTPMPADAGGLPSAPFWRAQMVGWGLFALVDLVNRQLTYRDFVAAAGLTLVTYPLLLLCSGGLRLAYRRARTRGRMTARTIGLVAALSPLAAAVVVAVIALTRQTLGWSIPEWRPLEEVALPLAHYTLAFMAWGLLYFWIRAERERQGAQARAVAAQLDAQRAEIRELQMQLDPHFLFNALNGLAEEVPEHPEAALAMLRDLTQYLRHLLAGVRTPVVPLAAEAEGLAAYLRIQQARFGDRVRASVDLDPAAAGRPISNLLLQPLVENAVEHGDRSTRLDVAVRLTADGDALHVEIENTGRLAPGGDGAHHGIGLENVRRRLDLHYPGRHAFALRHVPGSAGPSEPPRVIAVLRLEGAPCSAS